MKLVSEKAHIQHKKIEDLFSSKRNYYIILILFLLGYFSLNFVNGVNKGGRWDLYEHIAIADRFING